MKRNATLNYTSYLFLAAVVALAALPAQAQFAAATGYSTGADSSPNGVALGDINGDGNLDIVTANSHSDTAGNCLGAPMEVLAPLLRILPEPATPSPIVWR
jgi:hypothetical protein